MIDANSALFWVIPDEVNCIQFHECTKAEAWWNSYSQGFWGCICCPQILLWPCTHQTMLQLFLLQAITLHWEKWCNVWHTWWVWPFSKVISPLCPIIGHGGEELGSYHVSYPLILTSLIFSTPGFPTFMLKGLYLIHLFNTV